MQRREPLALALYRRFLGGESIAEIAAGEQIPEERVGQRIRAAAFWAEQHRAQQELGALGAKLQQER